MTARRKAIRKKAARKKAARTVATRKKKAARKRPVRSKQAARPRTPGSLKAARVARPGGGKPEVVIDPESLRILSKRLVPEREMAAALGISRSTLEAKIAESEELREAIYVGFCQIKGSLRTTQLDVALGNKKKKIPPHPGMLKYLGRVVLGQREPLGADDDDLGGTGDLTPMLTAKITEYAAKCCRERERAEREALKEE